MALSLIRILPCKNGFLVEVEEPLLIIGQPMGKMTISRSVCEEPDAVLKVAAFVEDQLTPKEEGENDQEQRKNSETFI